MFQNCFICFACFVILNEVRGRVVSKTQLFQCAEVSRVAQVADIDKAFWHVASYTILFCKSKCPGYCFPSYLSSHRLSLHGCCIRGVSCRCWILLQSNSRRSSTHWARPRRGHMASSSSFYIPWRVNRVSNSTPADLEHGVIRIPLFGWIDQDIIICGGGGGNNAVIPYLYFINYLLQWQWLWLSQCSSAAVRVVDLVTNSIRL